MNAEKSSDSALESMKKEENKNGTGQTGPSIGLIVNPIAGMGGAVGLKGTDGEEVLKKALSLGAKPMALMRAKEFLFELRGLKKKITIVTLPGVMGGEICEQEGFKVDYITDPRLPEKTELFKTKAEYTKIAAKRMKERKVAIIVFVGGDGTARNVYEAIGNDYPCLGIPAGVKIHSSVFAINPKAAGKVVLQFLWGEAGLRESEVMDIDEEAFRDNRVISKLYGYLLTPYSPQYVQPSKMATPQTEDEIDNQLRIAQWLIEEMEQREQEGEDWYYLIGPGTTPRAIATLLKQKKTLLGVDLMHNRKMIAWDLNEQQILEAIEGKNTKLIVTPIGAQGFVFGRGNLQLSSRVLEKIGIENIIIIATKYKISTLPNGILRVDTRDPQFDEKLKGYFRVLIDYGEYRIMQIES